MKSHYNLAKHWFCSTIVKVFIGSSKTLFFSSRGSLCLAHKNQSKLKRNKTKTHQKLVKKMIKTTIPLAYVTATPLGAHYSPSPYDVICDRKKEARAHPGNIHFHQLVEQFSSAYSNAKSKPQRSAVVTEIVNAVRSKATGGFVKFDKKAGQWVEVGERLAREKTGTQLRESLGNKYRSSHNFKRRVRKARNAQIAENMEQFVHCNPVVSQTIASLKQEVPKSIKQSDDEILLRFSEANSLMLEAMKNDEVLVRKFQQAEGSNHSVNFDNSFSSCSSCSGSDTDDSMSVDDLGPSSNE